MALEEIIAANTAAVEKQTAILEKLLSAGAKNTAAAATAPTTTAPAAEDKPKATTKPKADAKPKTETETKADAEITVVTLDGKFRPWLAEFEKDHPETAARKAKFKEILGKLGTPKMSEITDPAKLGKLDNWFETKAKVWDEGHGVGRLAADPAEEGDEEDGGDDDL